MSKPQTLNQGQAAALAGLTTRRLRQIQDEDQTLPRSFDSSGRLLGYPPKAFGDWLRARAAREFRVGDFGEVLDPVQERARLDQERRRQLELANQERAGGLIPFELIERMLGSAFAEIKAGLLGQHNTIASEHPEIPPDAIRGILRSNRELLQRLAEVPFPATLSAELEREACGESR